MEHLEAIKQFFKGIGINIIYLIAGVLGSYVSVSNSKELTKLEKIATVFSGGIIATYITPLVSNWMSMNADSEYGLAFVLGYMGLKGVEITIKKLKSKFIKDDKE